MNQTPRPTSAAKEESLSGPQPASSSNPNVQEVRSQGVSSQNSENDVHIDKMSKVHEFNDEQLQTFKLVHASSKNKELLKSFRELRTRLSKKMQGKNFVCLVTSVDSGGGGSFVARNLAAAVTMDKTKTALLVDSNLYAPSVDTLLGKKSLLGLTDFLDNTKLSVSRIVRSSGIARLRVITVGNNCDGGTEKIISERMKVFIQEIKERYSDRMIIVDGPSVGEYDAEIRILADLCDFVVLVVPDNAVNEAQINEAIASIGKEKMAGLVLNSVTD